MNPASANQTAYATTAGVVRRSFAGQDQAARQYYRRYVDFVKQFAPARTHSRLLDAGCGTGWSSLLFSEAGYDVTGADLNPASIEVASSERLHFEKASATELPFADDQFDAVASYQMIEHIEQPERALGEMLRVVRPGGIIAVCGPNLVSLGLAVRRPVQGLLSREPFPLLFPKAGMPRNPYGRTLAESLGMIFYTVSLALCKFVSPSPQFTMRRPDTQPPFGGDNDACYRLNPLDLVKFFRRSGCRLLRNGAPGRARGTAMLAGGTWVCAQKTE